MATSIIDIGSYSARLMRAEGGITLSKVLVVTKLGEGSADTCVLTDSAIARTVDAVVKLHAIACASGDTDVKAFATEALRRAHNKADVIERVRLATGMQIDVVSGLTEAKLGYIGATRGREPLAYLVIDVGGASTELASGCGSEIMNHESVAIGAVKLTDLSQGDWRQAESIAKGAFLSFDPPKYSGNAEVIAIGGTATTLASIGMEMEEYDSARVHNSRITTREIFAIRDRLAAMTTEQRLHVVGLQAARAEVIVAGIIIMSEVLTRLGIDSVLISESDNLEGYLQLQQCASDSKL